MAHLAIRTNVLALLLVALVGFGVSAQSRNIPNGELAIAYRQLEDGKLSEAVFQNWLVCSNGQCTLTSLTLGQCIAGAWYPKIQSWSTNEGSLSVASVSPGVLQIEFKESGAVFQMRFGFETQGLRFSRLTTFSGGVTKQSDVLNRVITWQMVPIRLLNPNVDLRCPASLDGIP